MIGYAICGSFCTHKKSLEILGNVVNQGCDVLPIVSEISATTDTRFGGSKDLLDAVSAITGHSPVCTIVDAEPLGPAIPLDALIIAPCTGNTLAKIANGITDTAVCMAAKAHMRTSRPLLIALASNDAMSANLGNIAKLLSKKNVYFVPLVQDDPVRKPHSLVADFDQLPRTIAAALAGIQLQPMLYASNLAGSDAGHCSSM